MRADLLRPTEMEPSGKECCCLDLRADGMSPKCKWLHGLPCGVRAGVLTACCAVCSVAAIESIPSLLYCKATQGDIIMSNQTLY